MLRGAVKTCDILLNGTQAIQPNATTRWNHQMTTWPVCIAASLISGSEAMANRLPIGDQAAQTSSVTAIRQPSIMKPVRAITKMVTRIQLASSV